MIKHFGIALILSGMSASVLMAAEIVPDQQQSSAAKRTTEILDAVGLNVPIVQELIETVDEHTHHGYLSLSERRVGEGTLKFHYEMEGLSGKNLELRYTPDDSHVTYTARPDEAMVRYQLRF
ncbi:MAG: hypothetical protein LW823_01575 [Rickettsiales bacterium]|jgi:hypothetical protein|nr:hypothetical protein [Rickettsiales bacterium]